MASGGKKAARVRLHLVPVGNAPGLKTKRFHVPGDQSFAGVITFLRRNLKLPPGAGLSVYLRSCFAPSPEQELASLVESFSTDGELQVQYSLTPAFG